MTVVQTAAGRIRGTFEDSVYVFRGIPYAEPLTGHGRWLPPMPRRPWTGILDACTYGLMCMQFDETHMRPVVGSRRRYLEAIGELMPRNEGDDCLLLNIWSPSLDSNARLPVMVFIHGGGFTHGAANQLYDASSFAQKGAVAVVIQYRLGVLGFLHGEGLFDGKVCADNRAFLDQIEALRWVQENITRFGGDASNVTIFGESAGAFSVYQLIASPLVKGLIKRAIAMGGMPFSCAPVDEYHKLTVDALNQAGVKAGDVDALVSLDRFGLRKLQSALSKLAFGKKGADRYGSIGRVRWSYLGAAVGGDFLPVAPLAAYETSAANGVDLMLGTCADDGQLFSYILPVATLSAWLFSRYLEGLMPDGGVEAAIAYYRGLMPGVAKLRVRESVNNDAFFRMPTLDAARSHARGSPGRTYLYEVDFASSIEGVRAIHGIDIALLFGRCSPLKMLLPSTETTPATSELMLSAWVNFATNGQPSAAGMPEWTPFDEHTCCAMILDSSPRITNDLTKSIEPFWSRARNQSADDA